MPPNQALPLTAWIEAPTRHEGGFGGHCAEEPLQSAWLASNDSNAHARQPAIHAPVSANHRSADRRPGPFPRLR